jgi:hypothetical protein
MTGPAQVAYAALGQADRPGLSQITSDISPQYHLDVVVSSVFCFVFLDGTP